MKLEQGQPLEALGILGALRKEAGSHTAALRLELRALQGAGRYEEIPPLELDREQIKRVIINLLDNAVAAVGENGEIRMATSHDPSRGVVYLEVADNGCGVPSAGRHSA